MKKLLYVLTSLSLLAGIFTNCEKESEKAKSTITGIVTDKETGESIPDVTLVLQGTDEQTTTKRDGSYTFDSLQAGSYTIRVQKNGYNEYVRDKILLSAGQTITLTIELDGEPFEPQEPELREDYVETAFDMALEMVYVQGGAFLMGATAEQGDDAEDNEKPVRRIKLNGYHIGKYEVTQGQWMAVMEDASAFDEGKNFPMHYVGWNQAVEFCKRLSEATGKKYVLPTEAQWEYAARGGNKSRHYKYAGSNDIAEVAWYGDKSSSRTYSVGTKKANELGIYDMSGNALEWCWDWYGAYDENDTENPHGPATGSERVCRGGTGYSDAVYCRVSRRSRYCPAEYGKLWDFRVVCISE